MKSTFNSTWFTYPLACAILTVMSCKTDKGQSFVTFDESIQHAIRDYVVKNEIDIRSRLVSTDWMVNPYRTDVYISSTSRDFLVSPKRIPTYYSVVSDSIVVLVYTGIEMAVSRDGHDIERELKDIDERDVRVEAAKVTTVRAMTLLYSSCHADGIREPTTDDLFYVPCSGDGK